MFDAFLQLIEKLIRLAEAREANHEKFIDRYVIPVYEDAEAIYKDYSSLLREIRRRAERAKRVGPLVNFLEDKRQVHLAKRKKIKALLTQRSNAGMLTRFERGVLGLLTGSVTALDDGHCSFEPLRGGDHTIKDVVRRIEAHGITHLSPENRSHILECLDRQIEGLDYAWRVVTRGYAELTVPKTRT